MNKCKGIRHALSMVIKNKRSYLMLSVTIVLSFTFFLSYMIYIDSNNMTEYGKDIYSDENIIEAMCPIEDSNNKKFDIFIKSLSKIKDTYYYVWKDAYMADSSYETILPNCLIVMPKSVWGMQDDLYNRIFIVDNKEFVLNKNQAIVSKEMYDALKNKYKGDKIIIDYPIEVKNNKRHILKLEIVNGCYSTNGIESIYGDNMYISYDTVKDIDYVSSNRHAFIYSKNPNKVVELMRNLEVAGVSTYENKLDAFAKINQKNYFKQVIAIILFVILGINLYSSFKNALNERKFEIGVKRAVGASKYDIIKQFMYEGTIVVAVNILVSAIISIIIFSFYKIYKLIVMKENFIIYISIYSVLIFLVVSIFMTVIFSLIFAIKSSKVEIIKHLKSE